VRDLPLRVSLVAALLALVALGLLGSGFAVATQLAGFLQHRTDAQLADAARPVLAPSRRGFQGSVDGQGVSIPRSRYYVAKRNSSGVLLGVLSDPTPDGIPPPTLPAPTAAITRLVQVLLVIGAAVLVLLGGLAYLVVRRSLRPLTEVERTAAAIAAGEFDRRVPTGGTGTEVGRLSLALNGMLSQLQTALDASAASARRATTSEQKMRRFVTDASHELRTPLTTIRGFAELYRQGAVAEPAAVARLMGRIEGEAQRMGLLVEDLLLLARLDAQRPLECRPVDLLALASDAVHDARAVAPERDVRMEVVDGPGTPEVVGDEGRLRQVLSNLVTNALAHTPAQASVTVRVGTDGPDVVLEVADTGPGLSAQDAERVFERFYRADSSRTRASGGTGLGLSIVAALVAAHRGTVGVESGPGTGAVFRVRLPRAADPVRTPGSTAVEPVPHG